MLLKPSNGYIELQLISTSFHNLDYYPINLSITNRTVASMDTLNISLRQPFSANINDYQFETMISAFWATGPNSASLNIAVLGFAIIPNVSYHTLEVFSPPTDKNIISKISFTYILLKISSFNQKITFINDPYLLMTALSPQNYSNVGISSLFNPYLSQKCIFGFRFFQ
jgi:hypothetical protein